MIFLTVGTQLPFDRLVKIVDSWAFTNKRKDIIAQVGHSNYLPKQITCVNFLKHQEVIEMIEAASVVIAHAGIGTIITAIDLDKPIIIFPRRMSLGEQRSDHQLATAKHLASRGLVCVAKDEEDLLLNLERAETYKTTRSAKHCSQTKLIDFISNFIEEVYS